ncbi:MAG: serine/threonine-protein kinase [Calothrix sp. MO_192.B10]|nr:serine/threonine-protein kinase [Calothrix sp. MO_192.B10]
MIMEILAERYQIQQQLGKKAGRRTLLARDTLTQEMVIVKVLSFGSDFEWNDLKLFEREAQILKSLSHPSIPRYLDYFEVNNLPHTQGFALVQTYIPASTLEQHLNLGRTFSEAEIKQIATSILEILIYLHQLNPPVIHRDIKPSNILLGNRSGNSVGQIYLIDFGSVQTVAAREGGTMTVVGTYGYMPPEQFGGRTVAASDLYSLGATLIYLLTGTHPADLPQKDLRIDFEPVTNISPGLRSWLKRLTEPSLDRRFSTAREALRALQQPQWDDNLAVGQPTGSKIKLDKQEDSLEIIIPGVGLNWSSLSVGLFAIAWNSFITFWTIGVVFIAPFPLNLPFILFSLPFWGAGISLAYMFLFPIFGRTRLRLNQQQISLEKQLFGFQFNVERPTAKENITKIEYIPQSWHNTVENNRHGEHGMKNKNTGKIIIYAGIRQYEISGNSSGIQSKLEVQWLAAELSDWLGIPQSRV